MKLAPPYSAALVDFPCENIVATSNFAIIRKIEHFDPQYLAFVLNSKDVRRQIQRYVEGTALAIIKISYLKELKIKHINNSRILSKGESTICFIVNVVIMKQKIVDQIT